MTNIPSDILKLAREAIMAEVKSDARWQYADGRCDHFAAVQAVAKAIMREREISANLFSGWNFDISQAPRGHWTETKVFGQYETERSMRTYHAPLIIAAGAKGVVAVSKWLPNEERWDMFTKDAPPLAWMPWPEHPHKGE